MNRNYGIVLGAVAIVLLMISSATAVAMPLSNESSNSGASVTNYVEPGIHISVMQKRILRAAINYVDDQDINLLLQEIVKKKGPVDSNDIEEIIKKNDINIGTITFGRIETGGPDIAYPGQSGGWAKCPRRPGCLIFTFLPIIFLYIHAVFQESFDFSPDWPVQITIGGEFINYEVRVLVIGFIGSVGTNFPPSMGFQCSGWAPIIIY